MSPKKWGCWIQLIVFSAKIRDCISLHLFSTNLVSKVSFFLPFDGQLTQHDCNIITWLPSSVSFKRFKSKSLIETNSVIRTLVSDSILTSKHDKLTRNHSCQYSQGNAIWTATWQNHQNECVPSEDSDQPGHPPILVRVFAVRLMDRQGPKFSSCGQRRLWSDWADATLLGFVMRRLIYFYLTGSLIMQMSRIKHIGFFSSKADRNYRRASVCVVNVPKNINRKVHGMSQSQAVANHWH